MEWLSELCADFAKMLSFSSYGWLTMMAVLDSSEDRVRSVLQDSFGGVENLVKKPIKACPTAIYMYSQCASILVMPSCLYSLFAGSLAVYTVSRLCKNIPYPEAPAMSLPQ